MIKSTASNHSQLYSDLSELKKIKSQMKEDGDESLRLAAQQFEQLFIGLLLRSMRDANQEFSKDNFMNTNRTRMYQDMMDNQISLEMAQSEGVGLTDILVRQLGGKQPVKQIAELKPLDIEERRLEQVASIAASALLAKARGQENPPGINLTETQQNQVDDVYNKLNKVADNQTLPDRFESAKEFVDKLMPLAKNVAGELGVDPRVLVAQAALETGWGRHMVRTPDGANSHNLFNIKADRSWKGQSAEVSTLEFRNGIAQREKANFRQYENYEASFRDYVNFLRTNPRYQTALERAENPYDYVRQLQDAGYATDPEYANKIENIFEGELLAQKPKSAKES